MYDRNRNRKNDPKSTIISLFVIVLFLLPARVSVILVLIALLCAPFVVFIRSSAKKKNQTPRSNPANSFDDCPKPFFCFHKDKGEHHVKQGKEIDPWDRPDIDISKYQRK